MLTYFSYCGFGNINFVSALIYVNYIHICLSFQLIQSEQLQRREYERTTREETDRKWQAIKHGHDELNLELKDVIKVKFL